MGRFPGSGAFGFDLHPGTLIGLVILVAVLLLCRSILARGLCSWTNLFYPVFIGCCAGLVGLIEIGRIGGFWIDAVEGLCIAILLVVELVLYENE